MRSRFSFLSVAASSLLLMLLLVLAGCLGGDGPSLFNESEGESEESSETGDGEEVTYQDGEAFGYQIEGTQCVKQIHGGCVPFDYNTFNSKVFGLSFAYPSDWVAIASNESQIVMIPTGDESAEIEEENEELETEESVDEGAEMEEGDVTDEAETSEETTETEDGTTENASEEAAETPSETDELPQEDVTKLIAWRATGIDPRYESIRDNIVDAGTGEIGPYEVVWEIFTGEWEGQTVQAEWIWLTYDKNDLTTNYTFFLITEPENFDRDQAVIKAAASSIWDEEEFEEILEG